MPRFFCIGSLTALPFFTLPKSSAGTIRFLPWLAEARGISPMLSGSAAWNGGSSGRICFLAPASWRGDPSQDRSAEASSARRRWQWGGRLALGRQAGRLPHYRLWTLDFGLWTLDS